MSEKERVIAANSQHYIAAERLAILNAFSNRGLALVVGLLGLAWHVAERWLSWQVAAEWRLSEQLQKSLGLLYCGAILAISFFEAPTKFKATQASRASLLDVGRLIFCRFGRVELLLSLVLQLGPAGDDLLHSLPLLVLAVNVMEGVFLQPGLDARARAIILDQTTLPSSLFLHLVYVLLEALKVLCLLVFAFFSA